LPGRIMHEVAFGPAPAVASPSARVAGVGLMDIIAGTPLWVWPLFGYLVYIGWMRTRDRVVEPWRLFVMPVVILALVLHNALSATSVGLSALLVCGAVVGALCGRAIGRRRPARL